MKNLEALTSSAPAASTKGVNGNGGGIRSSAASVSAPVLLTRRLMRCSRRGGTYRSRPFSPIFAPIQNVSAAPASDPAVARMGTTHAKVAVAGGEQDDGGVDAEWQREEQRRIERGQNDHADRRRAHRHERTGKSAHGNPRLDDSKSRTRYVRMRPSDDRR